MSAAVRIGIVEDLPQVREYLKSVIGRTQDLELVCMYRNAEEAFPGILDKQLDVVVSDIGLPGISGVDLIRKLKPFMPSVQFMVFTVHDDDIRVFEALKAGANGYMLKSSTAIALLEGIRELINGGAPMSASVARRLVDHLRPDNKAKGQEHKDLTARERHVLDLLSQGLLYKEIAAREGISISTVKQHIHSIYKKLHVGSREEAVERYGKRG